jgi:hypothetical protein
MVYQEWRLKESSMSIDASYPRLFDILRSKLFLATFASLLVITVSIVYVASQPWSDQKFIALSTVGSSMKADNYYPSGNSTVKPEDLVQWYINLDNHMGQSQFVSLRMYLLNSTQSPSFAENSTSEGAIGQIYESQFLLDNNAKVILPINWTINKITTQNQTIEIDNLQVNGRNVRGESNMFSSNGGNFRVEVVVFTYDSTMKEFVPLKNSNDVNGNNITWNQVWFKLSV